MEKHSLPRSIVLHLLPEILGGIVYFLLVPIVKSYGYPSFMALVMAGVLILIPIELGYLFFRKRKTGENFFGGIVKYLNPIPLWQYFAWIALIIVLAGLIFSLLDFTTSYGKELFMWIPSDLFLDMGLEGNYSKQKLIISYLFFFIFIVVLIPIVEELYFRGFLLPRMPVGSAVGASLFHSALFALYHTWTPWMFVARTFGVLPLIYIVKRKENIYLGIIAHIILNSLDFITGLIFILRM